MTSQADRSVRVSVMIPTLNEARNIEACLRSVAFADEVVVVDSNSTDGTQEIARAMGARVVNFDWNRQFPKKKNWALDNVDWRNEWILIVDADERVSPELGREIASLLRSTRKEAFYINRRFMFMGDWLNHCGYFPSWNLRLLRRGAGSYERPAVDGDTGSGDNEVHEHIILHSGESKATIGWCKHTLLHYAYPDISTWIEKHNRYSNWEAAVATAPKSASDTEVPMQLKGSLLGSPLQVKRWIKERAMRLPMRPTLRFFYHYVWKSGWRDGYRGFVFCRLLGWYEFLNWAKSIERRELSKAPATR